MPWDNRNVPHRDVPGRAYHKRRLKKGHVIRSCSDNRAYQAIPFTIRGVLATGDYSPMYRVHRDFYIAAVSATVGKHDSGTHPSDGTPSGASIKVNIRRILSDLSAEASVLGTDDVVVIAIDSHKDTSSNAEGDFAIDTLHTGDLIYVRVVQVGSGRPGTDLDVTVTLVPVRGHL